MKSFLLRVPTGEFERLADRNSLWTLLAAITLRKAVSLQRRQLAEKRDVRRGQSLDQLIRDEPAADFVDSVVSEGNSLLSALNDESLQRVARLRLEGYSNQEIANHIGRSVKTVERKLQLVRKRLEVALEEG